MPRGNGRPQEPAEWHRHRTIAVGLHRLMVLLGGVVPTDGVARVCVKRAGWGTRLICAMNVAGSPGFDPETILIDQTAMAVPPFHCDLVAA